jgi:predicted peptidase
MLSMTSLSKRLSAILLTLLLGQSLLAQDAITPASEETKPEATPSTASDPAAVFEPRVYKNAADGALPYRLLKPIDYDPQQKYPLVLFLHGAGERGDDNEKQLIHGGRNFADEPWRRRHGSFVVFPQCPDEKKWVEISWESKSHTMPEEPSEPLRLVFELLPALRKEFSIDGNRVYGVGLSMGGYGVWDILQRRPELLAAAVIVCGGGDSAYAERFASTPVWALHGAADPSVTPDRSRAMVRALQVAGGRPIYTEYEGIGHDSWTQTFDNRLIWDWLFAQRKAAPNNLTQRREGAKKSGEEE